MIYATNKTILAGNGSVLMRLATFVAFFCLALGTVPASAGDDWQTFNDPTGMFSISIPQPMAASNDTVTRKDGSVVKVIVYDLSLTAEDELMVRVADETGQNVDEAGAVESALNGLAGAYTIVSHVPVTLGGHNGEDVILTDAKGRHYTDRIFFMEGHLFQAITATPKVPTADQSAMASRFSQSLHFLR